MNQPDFHPALLPAGFGDVLPPEAELQARLVETVMDRFAAHGYQRVGPPLIEFEDGLFAGSGAMALFDSHPLQQAFRDVHSTGVHIGVDRADAYTSRGRVAMGFAGHPFH